MFKVNIYDEFGSFCSDSTKAIQYRISEIEPKLKDINKIVFDFKKVRNINSSFANVMFAGLIQIDKSALEKIYFENCNSKITSMVEIALRLGLKRSQSDKVC